ncbi:hypothetical protein AAHA92_00789 [Salvia divinorum]|uniref:Uncharacterized protein n=1 Tax=Salvia divinorum TaxID=28513 RepID=A0ABD1ILT0_SALDI
MELRVAAGRLVPAALELASAAWELGNAIGELRTVRIVPVQELNTSGPNSTNDKTTRNCERNEHKLNSISQPATFHTSTNWSISLSRDIHHCRNEEEGMVVQTGVKWKEGERSWLCQFEN